MSLPDLLAGTVGDEDVVAEVPLGGDDRLAVTPTRTLVYRGDGLLSDESVAEFSHDVERVEASTGRRKATVTLGYGLDGDETISVPTDRVDDVLRPILAGVLSAEGVTNSGESVVRVFRFSDLTLVVSDERLVKHVGATVWGPEFEAFSYADLTDLDFEEGTVATTVVLTHDGRPERFKAPNESARSVRATLVDAVCEYHGVDDLAAFRTAVSESSDPAADRSAAAGTTDFGEGPDPLSASPAADADGSDAGPNGDDSSGDAGPASNRTSKAPTGEPADGPDAGATEASSVVAPDSNESGGGAGDIAEDSLAAGASVDDAGRSEGSVGASRSGGSAGAGRSDGSAGAAAAGGDEGFDGSPFESAGVEEADLAAEVAALRHAVEAQSERLDRQTALVEQLIEELRRGR